MVNKKINNKIMTPDISNEQELLDLEEATIEISPVLNVSDCVQFSWHEN
jgi:hypothetical protein